MENTMVMSAVMQEKYNDLRNAVNAVNETVNAGGNIEAFVKSVTEATTAINAQIIRERVTALRGMEEKQMWDEFLDHQFIKGYAIDVNKETGLRTIVTPVDDGAKSLRVTYSALNSVGEKLVRNAEFKALERILHENIVRFKSADMGKEWVARNENDVELAKKRKTMGTLWRVNPDTMSKRKLVEMANEVLFAMLPDYVLGEIAGKEGEYKGLLKVDVTYLVDAIVKQDDNKEDGAGKYKVRNVATLENSLMTAAYTRRNNLAYKFQASAKGSEGEILDMTTNAVEQEEQAEETATEEQTAE